MDGLTWAAVAVVAAATVGGASCAGALRRSRPLALRVAAIALLAVVALDLAPDVVHDLAENRSARHVIAAACVAGFAAAALAARWVCACGTHPTTTTGLAIALHRTLEGAALVLAGSAGVVIALVLHAAGEGFALRAYGTQRDNAVPRLLLLACASPALGAVALSNVELPDALAPIVTALIAGTLVAGAARMIATARRPRAVAPVPT
jgi:hypothetical protein